MLDQYALLTAVNTALSTLGGSARPKMVKLSRACWSHVGTTFRSWALFSQLPAFYVSRGCFFGVLARSGLDFERFREVPGRVLEPPGTYFSRFSCACALAVSECSECSKTTVLVDRKTLRKQCAQRKKSEKKGPEAFRMRLPTPVVPKMHLGARRARFGRGLGPSRACMGGVWGTLGELLGTLGRLLGAF